MVPEEECKFTCCHVFTTTGSITGQRTHRLRLWVRQGVSPRESHLDFGAFTITKMVRRINNWLFLRQNVTPALRIDILSEHRGRTVFWHASDLSLQLNNNSSAISQSSTCPRRFTQYHQTSRVWVPRDIWRPLLWVEWTDTSAQSGDRKAGGWEEEYGTWVCVKSRGGKIWGEASGGEGWVVLERRVLRERPPITLKVWNPP